MIHSENSFGTHPTIDFGCGPLCTFNYDSVISSLLAVLVTIGIAFWIRSRLREGEPSRVQAIFEWGYDQLRGLIRENVSDDALFIIPLAMTLFLYILIANWIEIFPLALFPILHGANADLNQTLAMALIVIGVVQWYSVKTLGWKGYLLRFTKPTGSLQQLREVAQNDCYGCMARTIDLFADKQGPACQCFGLT